MAPPRRSTPRPRVCPAGGRSDGVRLDSTPARDARRQSQEIGGSVVLGGLDGRFGPTRAPSPVIARGKQDPVVSGDGLFDARPEEEEDDDDGDDDGDDGDDDSDDPPDNSPYAQVRASVSPVDNTSLSVNTPRMWCLSILFSILGSSTNLFFSLRYPSVAITPVIALLLVHPLGIAWDYSLKRQDDPKEEFTDGLRVEDARLSSESTADVAYPSWPQRRTRLRRARLWLAQGRWNEKEHACVYVSSNVSFGFVCSTCVLLLTRGAAAARTVDKLLTCRLAQAFATDIIVEQTKFCRLS